MEQRHKDELLDWLKRYRAATGEDRQRLAQQVEAYTAALAGDAEQTWLSTLLEHMNDDTPSAMVARRADLAVAELRTLMAPEAMLSAGPGSGR
jgi:hypothetical protein